MNIGDMHAGYTVIGRIEDRCVIAHSPTAPEPWVVWRLDYRGEAYSGYYTSDRKSAIGEFVERGFQLDLQEC